MRLASLLLRAATLAVVALMPACDRKAPYTFGVVLDQDGMRGAQMAMEEINAHGGINGHALKLRYVGGAGSTKARLALETASVLAADPSVLAVIGHTNSSASLAASQVYNAQHVVQIAPTSSAPIYSDAGPYSFRLVGSDLHQGVFVANQVLARTPRPRTAVMFVNDDYGRPLHEIFVRQLQTGGFAPVYDSPYIEGDANTDLTEVVDALTRAHPDLLVWIGRAYDYVRLQPMLKKALPKLVIMATDGFSGGTVAVDTTHLLDGVSHVRLVDTHRKDVGLQRLRARYEREHWSEPSDQAVLSYDAVLVLADAVRNAGAEREAIRDWLSLVGRGHPAVQGLSGPIAFTADGDREPQYFLEEIGKERLDSLRRQRR
ncbi:MAG: putative amino acid transporter substrate binding protein [Gemmatimonadetes bacterium]|nr:putative amino acid transporter substrate binding protein [Gemmatimonadota bacterium]